MACIVRPNLGRVGAGTGDGALARQIPPGRVSQEIITATDWLPTLAAMADANEQVPTDRPIDGIDISAHLFGDSEESGRDNFIFYGTDGELLTVKWKTMKVHFRKVLEGGALFGAYVKPQIPAIYDLWPIRRRKTTSPRPR